MKPLLLVAAILTQLAGPLLAEGLQPVSPGSLDQWLEVAGRCPTFNWTATQEAEIELVVYPVAETSGSTGAEPIVSVALPGSAQGWTPSLDRCLEPGERYAWSIRSRTDEAEPAWSEPMLFKVDVAPSAAELKEALATIRRHLSQNPEPDPEELAGAVVSPSLQSLHVGPSPGPGVSRPLLSQTTGASGIIAGFNVTFNGTAINAEGSDGGTGVRGSGGIGVFGSTAAGGGNGGFFIGYSGAQGLTVQGSPCCIGTSDVEHAATIRNFGGSGGDVLALSNFADASPGTGTNFVSFFSNSGLIGQIQGDGAGGIEFDGSLAGPSADFAEYLPKRSPTDSFEPGTVVGLASGKLSFKTRGADRAMVVSTRALVTGGRPRPEDESRFAKVAFMGRVPVRVRGEVAAGDLLIPSGRNDGTAIGRSDAVALEENQLIIGRALADVVSTDQEIVAVDALVGLAPASLAGGWNGRRSGSPFGWWFLAALGTIGLGIWWEAKRQSLGNQLPGARYSAPI